MKYIYIAVILTIIALAYAADPISMRNAATGSVFEGEWEKVYDPIELKFMSGTYFFTSLSDFNFEYYKIYDDYVMSSEKRMLEEFPFGIAFSNPFVKNLKHALLFRTRTAKVPELFDYDDYEYIDGGEIESYETTYYDENNDGIYDYKTIRYEESTRYNCDDKFNELIINNSFLLDEISLGLLFQYFTNKSSDDDTYMDYGQYDFGNFLQGMSGSSKHYWIEYYETDDDEYMYKISEDGDFNYTYESNQLKFAAAAMKPFDINGSDYEIRLDLGLDCYLDTKSSRDDKYYGEFEEVVIRDTLVESGFYKETYKNITETNENDLFIMLQTKRVFLKAEERTLDGFWSTGIGFGFISGDYQYENHHIIDNEQMTNNFSNDESDAIETYKENDCLEESGDYSGAHLDLFAKINLPLNEYADFGFAGYYKYLEKNRNTDYTRDFTSEEMYQSGEEFDSATEAIIKETSHITADKEFLSCTTTFKVPVGLEFRLPQKDISLNDGFGLRNFIFRIGSVYTYRKYTTEATYDNNETYPLTTITEYGNGEISESHDEQNSLYSEKKKSTTITSRNVYTGGIGYKHSENVSIDLGGYIDENTKDYFVGLSFTIKK